MVKLKAGKNAKAKILTRMIKPPQPIQEHSQRSDILLVEQYFDNKGKKYYRFRYVMDSPDAPLMHALAHWVRIVEEARAQDFFEIPTGNNQQANKNAFIESSIPWQDSKARHILYNDIVKNIVPINARDENNKSTMKLKDIYNMHPEEYHQYAYSKFSSRLSNLRKIVKTNTDRARSDKAAFDRYVANHSVSMFSAKGFIQWQGSASQQQAKKDIEAGKLEKGGQNYVGFRQLFEDPVYHEHFPFKAFRDKMRQEIKTAKYIHTIKLRRNQQTS